LGSNTALYTFKRLVAPTLHGGPEEILGSYFSGSCRVVGRQRAPVLDFRCPHCGRVFNAYTGTLPQGTQRRPSELVLIVRGIAQGVSTAQVARELGRDRSQLLELRHRLREAASANRPRMPLDDPVLEADEMYQNAGEKRSAAPGPRRPTASSGQPAPRARQLGQRPAADLRHREAEQGRSGWRSRTTRT
jgi:transposase-like protein